MIERVFSPEREHNTNVLTKQVHISYIPCFIIIIIFFFSFNYVFAHK